MHFGMLIFLQFTFSQLVSLVVLPMICSKEHWNFNRILPITNRFFFVLTFCGPVLSKPYDACPRIFCFLKNLTHIYCIWHMLSLCCDYQCPTCQHTWKLRHLCFRFPLNMIDTCSATCSWILPSCHYCTFRSLSWQMTS